jgi:copper chaperone CopZ
MIKEEFKLSGMSCSHCIKSVESALSGLPVEKYEVKQGSAYVEYDPEKLSKKQITDAIENMGYEVINDN